MLHIPPSIDRVLMNFSQEIADLSYGPGNSIDELWDQIEP